MKRWRFDADDAAILLIALSLAFAMIVFAFGSFLLVIAAVVFYPITIAVACALWLSELAMLCWRRIWV